MNSLILLITPFLLNPVISFSGEKMDIEGSIQIANSDVPSPDPGTIRWTGTDFQGYDGSQWNSLTSATSGINTAITNCFLAFPNGVQILLDF